MLYYHLRIHMDIHGAALVRHRLRVVEGLGDASWRLVVALGLHAVDWHWCAWGSSESGRGIGLRVCLLTVSHLLWLCL